MAQTSPGEELQDKGLAITESGELVAVFPGLKDFRMNVWGKSVL